MHESNGVFARFCRHRLAVAGLAILLLIAIVCVAANFLAPADPNFIDEAHWSGPPLNPGDFGHILGTDENGRDLLSRLMFGGRVSLVVALCTVVLEVVIGTIFGALAGYYGGIVDYILMRVTDVVLAMPLLPLLLVLTAIVASKENKAALSLVTIVAIIGLLSWPPVARLVRAEFLSLREREYTEAARAIGGNDARIMLRHLLPNAAGPIIVQATLSIADVIILESTLSFLGFGIQAPTASWGNMLANAESNMTIAPWAAICPGLCILITVLAVNYVGDGLRDALDPHAE